MEVTEITQFIVTKITIVKGF